MSSSRRARSIRWVAPFVVAAVIGLVALVPTLSAGADPPTLPPLTAEQLIVKVRQANVQAFTGGIRLTTNLGLPDLGALGAAAGGGSGFNPTDLLSGTHDATVWFDGPDRQRIALPSTLAEFDVIHNGQDLWTWDSSNQAVTHTQHAAPAAKAEPTTPEPPTGAVETPDQAAQKLLDQITPSTGVTVTTPDYVADQAVYELVLTPNSPASTVDHAAIAVDAATGLPLQVSVFAKGQGKAALQLGFTSIDYSRPAASTFNFTPPPGSTVNAKPAPRGHRHAKVGLAPPVQPEPAGSTPGKSQTVGQDWSTVVISSLGGQSSQQSRQINEVLQAATPVSGTWGSGKLLTTALINVIMLDDGRVAAGAVNPAALEAAIASAH